MEHRETPVTLRREVITGVHPVTGENLITWVESSLTGIVKGVYDTFSGEKIFINGFEVRTGDIKITFNRTDILDLSGTLQLVIDSKRYSVVNVTPKGLGAINRYEVIGRLIP